MKKLIAIVLVLVMALGLVACGSKPATNDTPATTAAPEQTTAAPAENTEAQGNEDPTAEDHTFETEYWANLGPNDPITWNCPNNYKRVGMVVPDGTGEFYVSMCTAAEAAFKEAGYEFVWTGANDAEATINTVETWVNQGVDALILLVQDTACDHVVQEAMKQGVLIVLGSATLSSYHVWCCQDYHTIGYDVAKMAAEDMKAKFGDDAAYITIGGNKAEFQTQKTNGVNDGMDELYPNGTRYEINDSSDVQGDVETMLAQHPEIKAVVSWHTSMTMAALSAVKALNLNDPEKFAIYGSQMVSQSLIEIKDTTNCYVSDTWMGDQGKQYTNVVLTLLNGGTVNHYDFAPDFVVNAENAETYYEDYYALYGNK